MQVFYLYIDDDDDDDDDDDEKRHILSIISNLKLKFENKTKIINAIYYYINSEQANEKLTLK